MKKRVVIVGAGAAGMAAAIAAAETGAEVTLLEKNEKTGKKIYITGKGRCNFTNDCDLEQFFRKVVSNPRFLYSSLYGFTNQQMIDFLEGEGIRTKVERGGRAFPLSDHASDVTKALNGRMKKAGVKLFLNTEVTGLRFADLDEPLERKGKRIERRVSGVKVREVRWSGTSKGPVSAPVAGSEREIAADCVIITTGGLSYPSTGSTGDGYDFALTAGHSIVPCSPSLVPFETQEPVGDELMGLSLKNVEAAVYDGKKEIFREFGEMMFTHFGVTGPIILSASAYSAKRIRKNPLKLILDLKPALSEQQLDDRILRDFDGEKNREYRNSLSHLFPARLAPVMVRRSGIDPYKKVNEVTREERRKLVQVTKNFELTLTGLRGFNEAIVTQGGVSVKEVDPSTMESKLTPGLYFAGEVLDLDAETGGYNLQIAWSTGVLAGKSAAKPENA